MLIKVDNPAATWPDFNLYGLKFHHLGLAVAHPDKAVRFARGLEYRVGPAIFDPLQKVNLIMCRHPTMPDIEIIFSAGEPGPLDGILKERTESFYHIAFESRDLSKSLQAIKGDGNRVICLSPPKKAVLFDGKPVSFYQVVGFGLIEIVTSP